MPVTFRILRERGIVYVRYSGFAGAAESLRAFAAYRVHPDCRPGQKHLVDLADVTDYDRDFARLLELQAMKAEQFVGQPVETLLAYYAPTPVARQMAAIVLRSWEGTDHVVARLLQSEAEALHFLGQPEDRIADLLAVAG